MPGSEPTRQGESGRYLFIIGAARSGTRLVRGLLAGHPDAAPVPYDVNYIWRFGNERLPHDELTPELLTEAIRERIIRHLNRFRKGRPLLVEKTVSNCLRVPYVLAAFPDARFVHLIRDPVDVVESAYRKWQADPNWAYILRKAARFPVVEAFAYARDYAARVVASELGMSARRGTWGPRYRGIDEDLERTTLLEVCAIQADRCMQSAIEGLAEVPDEQVLEICYEDFVRDPAGGLPAMFAFAGMRADAIDAAQLSQSVTDAFVGRGWRELADRQRKLVLAKVSSHRDGLGYPPTPLAATVRVARDDCLDTSGEPAAPEHRLSSGHLQYFWRGRVALYAILKALGVGPGDQVIVPGYTCVAVPNAVYYTGATALYADINPNTYNVSRETIEPCLTPAVRAVIVQSTYGLSADLDPILELAGDVGVAVVEDCAHGLGGSYKGRPNGTIADAAFFSTQWSKPISTGLGGVAFVRDDGLSDRLEELAREMPPPPFGDRLLLGAQLMARPLADHPRSYYPFIGLYRWLTQRAGLQVGSSASQELRGTAMPKRFAQRMAPKQRRRWERGLETLAGSVARRRQQAAFYDEFFEGTAIRPPTRPDYARHAMLRYTVRVADNDATLRRARALNLPLGNWFVSPLHPVSGDLRPWGYEPGTCPHAEQACHEVVNLLTDRPLSAPQLATLFAGEVS